MRIAVTGACGFIGQRIVQDIFDRFPPGTVSVAAVDFFERLIPEFESKRYPILDGIYLNASNGADMLDPYEFLHDVTSFDVIIHAGAVADTMDLGGDGSPLWDRNVDYVRMLSHKLDAAPNTKLVFISSAAVYGTHGHPNNPYGLSKSIGETIVKRLHRRVAILRPFNVFGEFEHHKGRMASIPFKLANAYRNGEFFSMHSPEARRDFVPVSSVSQLAIAKAQDLYFDPQPQCIGVFDVGTGAATSFHDLDTMIMNAARATTTMTKIVKMPDELAGRYQGFTMAGMRGERVLKHETTAEGIERFYNRSGAR